MNNNTNNWQCNTLENAVREKLITTYEKRVVKKDNCWQWRGAKFDGYGTLSFSHNKRSYKISAHRASWIIYHGKIERAFCICHKCDNRECTNPNHLFMATHTENMLDAVAKGRKKSKYKDFKLEKCFLCGRWGNFIPKELIKKDYKCKWC